MPTWNLPFMTLPGQSPVSPDRTLQDLTTMVDGDKAKIVQVGVLQSDGTYSWSDPSVLELEQEYAPVLTFDRGSIDETLHIDLLGYRFREEI